MLRPGGKVMARLSNRSLAVGGWNAGDKVKEVGGR